MAVHLKYQTPDIIERMYKIPDQCDLETSSRQNGFVNQRPLSLTLPSLPLLNLFKYV